MNAIAFCLTALICEILGTVSGFGSSTVFVPAALLFEQYRLVLALTAILHVISNSTKLILFRGGVAAKDLWWWALLSTVLTAAGAALTTLVPSDLLKIGLGLVLMAIACSRYILVRLSTPFARSVLTGLSGFFTGLVGTGGALRAVALQSMNLEKNAFVFASSFIDFGGDVLRAGIYLRDGYMDWQKWYFIPLLLVAAILGPYWGRAVLKRLPQAIFERGVTVLIFLSGLALLVDVLRVN